MLTNSEAWINITQENVDELTKPDTMLQRELLSISGNPCKEFMNLEMGIIPVKFVMMGKRVKFLNTILNENTDSTMREV